MEAGMPPRDLLSPGKVEFTALVAAECEPGDAATGIELERRALRTCDRDEVAGLLRPDGGPWNNGLWLGKAGGTGRSAHRQKRIPRRPSNCGGI